MIALWFTKHVFRRFLSAGTAVVLLAGCSGSAWEKKIKKKYDAMAWSKSAEVVRALGGVDDSARIVYVAVDQGTTQLHSMLPDGSGDRVLTSGPGYKTRPAWSMDHNRIAFFVTSSENADSSVSVMLINADGSGGRVLLADKKIDFRRARVGWNPAGTRLYVAEKDFPFQISGYDLATGQAAETIRLPRQSFMTEVHSISPNLKLLAGAGPAKDSGILHIGVTGTDGEGETDLLSPIKGSSFHLGTVVWSYHSQLVAFEIDTILMVMSSTFDFQFKAYPISPMELNGELFSPAFSPTGQKLVCVQGQAREGTIGAGDMEVGTDIWVMDVNGTHQRQLTHNNSSFDPCW